MIFKKNFRGNVFHCSVINVHFLFALVVSALCILAHCFWFVKNFFQLFYFLFQEVLSRFSFPSQPCVSYQIYFCLSRTFFNFFYFLFLRSFKLFSVLATTLCILSDSFLFVNTFFQLFYFLITPSYQTKRPLALPMVFSLTFYFTSISIHTG